MPQFENYTLIVILFTIFFRSNHFQTCFKSRFKYLSEAARFRKKRDSTCLATPSEQLGNKFTCFRPFQPAKRISFTHVQTTHGRSVSGAREMKYLFKKKKIYIYIYPLICVVWQFRPIDSRFMSLYVIVFLRVLRESWVLRTEQRIHLVMLPLSLCTTNKQTLRKRPR